MSDSSKKTTVEFTEELMVPIAEELGLELWDVRFEKEGTQWYLRYLMDKPGGIFIADCEAASRAISQRLDDEDPIKQKYILEVGSPGIERQLNKDSHFQKYIDSDVMVRFIRPIDNMRNFVGRLVSKEKNTVTIELEDDVEMTFDLKEAAFVRLYVEF